MKVLAVDYGEKKLGLAISDEMGIVASPMPTIQVSSLADAVGKVHTISANHNIDMILVGLPLGAKGEETQQSMQSRYFAQALQDTNGTPIEYWDESFSTQMAESGKKSPRKKKNLDSEAARIILQEYLDSKSIDRGKYVSPKVKMNLN